MTAGSSESEAGSPPDMRIDWDVPIEMADGVVLRADVYRPNGPGRYPVVLSYGPYGKWLHFSDGSPRQWKRLISGHPDVAYATPNRYQCYELVDPERWVPDGYACVRVDSRGAGRSEGVLDPWSPQEVSDLSACIEWAGTQDWSNGRVGLSGISYYAMNQWQVAEMKPPHLSAMCVWEGASDLYRELAYHGGILCTFADHWYRGRVVGLQHGIGERGPRSRFASDLVCGPETLPDEVLVEKRVDYGGALRAHPLFDDYWADRVPDLSKIDVPLLSAGNWGGAGLHLRGNVEGFTSAGSKEKWLEIHGLEHWTHFYTDYGVELQKRFFGHFLKDEDTGWQDQPRVSLNIRYPGDRFVLRGEEQWPLARTRWTEWYLDAGPATLGESSPDATGSRAYDAVGGGITFLSNPLSDEAEFTGPMAVELYLSSDTDDADVFLAIRVFREDMKEVTFQGANEPNVPVGQGWLRASHRALDPERSLPWRPYHRHTSRDPLEPGEVYKLNIEIWPTSIVIPRGYRVGLTIRGQDHVYPYGASRSTVADGGGVGPFLFRHDDSSDRPSSAFGGRVTIHTGEGYPSHMLVPVIPRD